VQSALHDKGLDLSLDEIARIRSTILTAAEQGGELSEEQLESISGGFIFGLIPLIFLAVVGTAMGVSAATRRRW
jgi:hypothetical protein